MWTSLCDLSFYYELAVLSKVRTFSLNFMAFSNKFTFLYKMSIAPSPFLVEFKNFSGIYIFHTFFFQSCWRLQLLSKEIHKILWIVSFHWALRTDIKKFPVNNAVLLLFDTGRIGTGIIENSGSEQIFSAKIRIP